MTDERQELLPQNHIQLPCAIVAIILQHISLIFLAVLDLLQAAHSFHAE